MSESRLVVLSGLPGTGKTRTASYLAQRLRIVHLSIDAVEESLMESGLPPGWTVGVAAYEAVRTMAELNLSLGHDVVVDAVNDSEDARQTWRRAARSAPSSLTFVNLHCSDVVEHRRRLANRDRGFVHVGEPTWTTVQKRQHDFEPWHDVHLTIDTVGRTVGQVADEVIDFLKTT